MFTRERACSATWIQSMGLPGRRLTIPRICKSAPTKTNLRILELVVISQWKPLEGLVTLLHVPEYQLQTGQVYLGTCLLFELLRFSWFLDWDRPEA